MDMHKAKTIGTAVASAVFAAALVAGCSDKPDALVAQAKQSLEKHDRNTAVIQLKNALQANPDIAEARLMLGKALLDQGDPAAAEKELKRARDLKAPDDDAVPPLARAMIMMNEPKQVIDEFGKL
jgi:cytochrome c-type biogenesis protein CcmH/NrfG